MFNQDFLCAKVVLVRGASRGIVRGITLALAEAGADVIVQFERKASMAEMIVGQTLYPVCGFSLLTDYFPECERSLQMEKVLP